MGGGDEHALHEVLLLGGVAHDAPAAPVLGSVYVGGDALYVAEVGHGHHHVLLLDHVVQVDVLQKLSDLRPPGVGVLLLDGDGFLLHDAHELVLVGQNVLQFTHPDLQGRLLVVELIPLETNEALQAHVQNSLTLPLGKAEALGQSCFRLLGAGGCLDDLDHLVDVVRGDDEALQDVEPLQRPIEVEPGPPGHHVLLVLQIVVEHIPEVQHPGFAVYQRQQYRPKGVLQGGVLVKVVQDHLSVHVPLELDDDAGAVPVGLVPKVGDTLHLLFLHQLGDALHQPGLVHLVGDLGDDDPAPVGAHLLDLGLGANHDPAPAGAVRLRHAHAAHDDAPRGEVGAGDVLHEVVHGDVRVVDHGAEGVRDLAQVVGRDVGGHAHSDAAGAVDQQVREPGGEHGGLLQGFIEVGHELHRVLVDVRHHLRGHLGEACFGVSHGGGAVPIHGAEVAVALHQQVAGVEGLGHAHHGVVNRGVPVGMVLAQHVAHDAGALAEGLVWLEPQLVHGVEDPAMDGLQAVPHVGQGPVGDDRHGVGDEALAHLMLQEHGDRAGHDAVALIAVVVLVFAHIYVLNLHVQIGD